MGGGCEGRWVGCEGRWVGCEGRWVGCEGEGEVQAESEAVKTYPLCKATGLLLSFLQLCL